MIVNSRSSICSTAILVPSIVVAEGGSLVWAVCLGSAPSFVRHGIALIELEQQTSRSSRRMVSFRGSPVYQKLGCNFAKNRQSLISDTRDLVWMVPVEAQFAFSQTTQAVCLSKASPRGLLFRGCQLNKINRRSHSYQLATQKLF